MPRKRVIVVGAGLAGLSAGLYAIGQELDCTILEQHDAPGGVAATWRRGEYIFDGGIHNFIGAAQGTLTHELYRELGILPGLPLAQPRILMRFLDERTDRAIDLSSNTERFVLELAQLAPNDKEKVGELMHTLPSPRILDYAVPEQPLELMRFRDRTRYTWRLRRELRFFGGPFIRPCRAIADTLEHPFLKSIVAYLCHPEAPLCLALGLMAAHRAGNVSLLREGCISLVSRLAEQYEDRGGELRTGVKVVQILTPTRDTHNRETRVLLDTGEELRADYVIYSGDINHLSSLLQEKREFPSPIGRKPDLKPYRPLVIVSLGVARMFSDVAPMNTVFLRRPFFVGEKAVDVLRLRVFSYAPTFAPAGKTVLQAIFEVPWAHWATLAEHSPSAYQEEKDRMVREVVRRLEVHFPGIARQVELSDVATPYTVWRYTGNSEGSYAGWLPTPEALATAISRRVAGMERLFLAGHWCAPGGGVAASLASGRQAVQLICAAERLPFRRISPSD